MLTATSVINSKIRANMSRIATAKTMIDRKSTRLNSSHI